MATGEESATSGTDGNNNNPSNNKRYDTSVQARKERTSHIARHGILKSVTVLAAAAIVAGVTYYYSQPPAGIIPQGFATSIYIITTLVGGYLLTRIISTALIRLIHPTFGITKAQTVKNFFQIVAAILIITVIFGLLRFDFTGWLIGAGFIGIVLGLAAQQVLGNLFAGLALLASHPFEIGDRLTLIPPNYGIIGPSYPHEIMVNGYTGVVKDVGIFYSHMALDDGVPLVLPNSVIIASLVMNHARVKERTVRLRMDLDKTIVFAQFKKELGALLNSAGKREYINPGTLHIDIVDIGLTTYQVAIWLWSTSTFEEPIKTIIAQAAIEVQSRLAIKA